jgi:hypothetical protein
LRLRWKATIAGADLDRVGTDQADRDAAVVTFDVADQRRCDAAPFALRLGQRPGHRVAVEDGDRV